MPLVKPDYGPKGVIADRLIPGRYTVRVLDCKESDRLDKNGANALVVKFEVVNHPNHAFNGKKLSRWLPLAGKGAKVLYTFIKAIDPTYSGQAFTTESLIGKVLEADVLLEANPKDGKVWAKIDRVYPYLSSGSVGTSFTANVSQDSPAGSFDDFDV